MRVYTKQELEVEIASKNLHACKTCKTDKPISKFPRKFKKDKQKWYYEYQCSSCRYLSNGRHQNKLKWQKDYRKRIETTLEGRACTLRNRCKQRAKRYGYEFDLSKELIITKLKKGICEATNIPLVLGKLDYNPYAPSIDRIDSNKGYTNDNIQVTCMIYNFCKNKFTDEQVNDFIANVKKANG